MSTPAVALKAISQRNIRLITDDGRAAFEFRLRQSVQDRAYQIFQSQGEPHGQDQANWAQAEGELLQFAPAVRESGAWCTANVSLHNVDPQDVEVLVLPHRAIVAIARPSPQAADEQNASSAGSPNPLPAHFLIRWRFDVDPATAAAYLKDGTLVITAKHCTSMGGI
jgi:hypothetical protein